MEVMRVRSLTASHKSQLTIKVIFQWFFSFSSISSFFKAATSLMNNVKPEHINIETSEAVSANVVVTDQVWSSSLNLSHSQLFFIYSHLFLSLTLSQRKEAHQSLRLLMAYSQWIQSKQFQLQNKHLQASLCKLIATS